MEGRRTRFRWQPLLPAALAAVGVIALWDVIAALLVQLGAAAMIMLLCLPLCRLMEKKIRPGPAALLSLIALAAVGLAAAVLILPPVLRQLRQLTEALPSIIVWAQEKYALGQAWLGERGLSMAPVWDGLFAGLGERAGAAVTATAGMVTGALQSAGKLLLSPLLAFYLLRDRARFAAWLTLAVPVKYRAQAVRAAREMRRETAGFLRGQLLLSLAVGSMTAAALLLAGTPGWLLLGVLMGVMELVPYIGPLIAGVPAVLLALQDGLAKALWTVAALLIVQQLESAILSPRLLSGATQLHPVVVLLAISAGGMLGGAWGMLLVIPALVSVRGAVRGWRR